MGVDFLSAILMTLTAAPEVATQAAAQTVAAQSIPDRISVIGPDPYFAKAAADLRLREAQRAEYEERDYQRRMQALMYLQSVPSFASYDPYPPSWSHAPYASAYYYPTYGGIYYRPGLIAGGARPAHPSRPPHVAHHASRSHSGTRGGGGRGR
jgi:hypothetical protein